MTQQDSGAIYGNISNLKHCRNSSGGKYYINDYRTEKDSDHRQRIKDIMMDNTRMPVSHQMQMEVKGANLFVNEDRYEKEVEPPTAKDVLLTTKAKEKELQRLQIFEGPSETCDGSTFYSYAAKADTLEDVKVLYHKIKMENVSATHISCAYRIFGIKHHNYQDYADDGEIGAGRRILTELKTAKVFNVAIFILRYKAGGNIGPVRFQIVSNLAKQAVALIPEAADFGKDFQNQDKILRQSLTQAGIHLRRGRGAGRGRGGPKGGHR